MTVELNDLETGDVVDDGYTEWEVVGIIREDGEMIGVEVNEAREQSLRMTALDAEDLQEFEMVG